MVGRCTYPEYKDSEIDWLGEIPDQWEIKRLKFISKINPSRSELSDISFNLDISFHPMEAIGEGRLLNGQVRQLEELGSGYSYFRDGDVLIAKITPSFENGKGALATDLVNGIGFGTTEIHVIRPLKEIDRNYLFYVSYSHHFRKAGAGMMQGTAGQKRVPDDFIRNYFSAIPPIHEQHGIAAFLDRETARIDTLVEKKERQIELLKEKRSALISHAVTKGLNPDAPMKDSGIEWLGKIPEHWRLLPLRRVVAKFVDYRGRTPEKVEEGIPLITARNIRNGGLDFSESQEYIKEEDYESWMVRGWPEEGDVLITTEAPLGAAAQIEDTFVALAQRLIMLKVNNNYITNDYLLYHFLSSSGQGELWSRATGSTAIGIKAWRFKETLVTVPTLHEQIAISNFIVKEIEKIETPVSKIKLSIKILREYRTALISAAVTGKIDVRGEII